MPYRGLACSDDRPRPARRGFARTKPLSWPLKRTRVCRLVKRVVGTHASLPFVDAPRRDVFYHDTARSIRIRERAKSETCRACFCSFATYGTFVLSPRANVSIRASSVNSTTVFVVGFLVATPLAPHRLDQYTKYMCSWMHNLKSMWRSSGVEFISRKE